MIPRYHMLCWLPDKIGTDNINLCHILTSFTIDHPDNDTAERNFDGMAKIQISIHTQSQRRFLELELVDPEESNQ